MGLSHALKTLYPARAFIIVLLPEPRLPKTTILLISFLINYKREFDQNDI